MKQKKGIEMILLFLIGICFFSIQIDCFLSSWSERYLGIGKEMILSAKKLSFYYKFFRFEIVLGINVPLVVIN